MENQLALKAGYWGFSEKMFEFTQQQIIEGNQNYINHLYVEKERVKNLLLFATLSKYCVNEKTGFR